jgi:hypothetical protein
MQEFDKCGRITALVEAIFFKNNKNKQMFIKLKKTKFFEAKMLAVSCLIFSASAFMQIDVVRAATATLTLVPSVDMTASPVVPGGSFDVAVNMDTDGNVVVARAMIRYNKNKLDFNGWSTTNSEFVLNNNACFAASDPGDPNHVPFPTLPKAANSPCKIENNDTTNGIVAITLATDKLHMITGSNKLVATASFTAKAGNATNINALTDVMGLQYTSDPTVLPTIAPNYNVSSNVIQGDAADQNNVVDILTAPTTQRSTVQYGDLNGDRFVNGADLSILRANYGNTDPLNVANINGSSTLLGDNSGFALNVNGADLSILRSRYNGFTAY